MTGYPSQKAMLFVTFVDQLCFRNEIYPYLKEVAEVVEMEEVCEEFLSTFH